MSTTHDTPELDAPARLAIWNAIGIMIAKVRQELPVDRGGLGEEHAHGGWGHGRLPRRVWKGS